ASSSLPTRPWPLIPRRRRRMSPPALYSYAKDNPVTFTDPDGRDVIIARGYDARGHKESYIGEAGQKLADALSADQGGIAKERVHYIGYEEIESEVKKIQQAGRSVSAFVYVGHAEEQNNTGELIPNQEMANNGKGPKPKTERERYPT